MCWEKSQTLPSAQEKEESLMKGKKNIFKKYKAIKL